MRSSWNVSPLTGVLPATYSVAKRDRFDLDHESAQEPGL